MTETAPGYYQNNTETLQQQKKDITKKRKRHDREITEISPKQDIAETSPTEIILNNGEILPKNQRRDQNMKET